MCTYFSVLISAWSLLESTHGFKSPGTNPQVRGSRSWAEAPTVRPLRAERKRAKDSAFMMPVLRLIVGSGVSRFVTVGDAVGDTGSRPAPGHAIKYC